MKKGIASRGKESSPVTDFCARIIIGISVVAHIQTPVAKPRVIPMGILRAMVTNSTLKRMTASIV